jgi:serine/threonine protein kinase
LVTDLAAYVNGTVDFPTNSLRTLKASEDGIDFIQELMKVLPGERLTASEALDHAWFDELRDASPRSSGEFQRFVIHH